MGPRFSGKVHEEPQRRERKWGEGRNYAAKDSAIRTNRCRSSCRTFRIAVHIVPHLGLHDSPCTQLVVVCRLLGHLLRFAPSYAGRYNSSIEAGHAGQRTMARQ